MIRSLTLVALLGTILVAPPAIAENQVRWTVRIAAGGAASTPMPLPFTLFQNHPLPIKGSLWGCFADKWLRQDVAGNTYSAMTIHCTDGTTTVRSAVSCQIGGHDSGKASIELIEKTNDLHNEIQAQCEG